MTSVPIPFWPNNLSSLAWLGIIIFFLAANAIGFNWATYGILVMLGIFILDQIILGPIWYRGKREL